VSEADDKLLKAIRLVCKVRGEVDRPAEQFLLRIAEIARGLDDVCDADHGRVDVAGLAHQMMFDLPASGFYHKHLTQLLPVISMALNAWADANAWERDKEAVKRTHAFVIREEVINVALTVARILGGWGHMRAVSLKVREICLKPLELEKYHREFARGRDFTCSGCTGEFAAHELKRRQGVQGLWCFDCVVDAAEAKVSITPCAQCGADISAPGAAYGMDGVKGLFCRGCYERHEKVNRGTKHGKLEEI